MIKYGHGDDAVIRSGSGLSDDVLIATFLGTDNNFSSFRFCNESLGKIQS